MERLKDILLMVLTVALVGFVFKECKGFKECKDFKEADTVRVVVFDTVHYPKPALKEEKPLGKITAKLPVSVPRTSKNVPNSLDRAEKADIFVPDTNVVSNPDSVNIEIPITQRVYEGDNYRAFVSGYNANLDSLSMFVSKETMTIAHQPKQKRWTVGIQIGYGMALKGTPQFAPYIGVGVQYNLWGF